MKLMLWCRFVAPMLFLLAVSTAHAEVPKTTTFTNPLKAAGADPCLVYHDGFYYLTTTTGRDIQMRRAKSLEGLKTAKDKQVWKDRTPGRSRDIWATEFHLLDNGRGRKRWYGYYTASAGPEPSHRMFVIESSGTDPMGPYHFKAKLVTDPKDEFYAIDGSVLTAADGSLTFVWCGRPSPHGQGLYLAKMSNPWTISGPRQVLEADGFGCPGVREGPVGLTHGGKVWLVYSMCSADSPDYRLGALVADATSNLAEPASWKQYPTVLFSRNDEAKAYGPGHCYFFKSPDGKEDWIVYHAKTTTATDYADRTARAQRIHWNVDGTPDFGRPVGGEDIAEPSSVERASRPGSSTRGATAE